MSNIKLLSKAYHAKPRWVKDYGIHGLFYADSASAAKSKIYTEWAEHGFSYTDIRVKRAAEFDLVENVLCETAKALSSYQIEIMLHTIGQGDGIEWDEDCQRNYYCFGFSGGIENKEPFDDLVRKGLMTTRFHKGIGHYFYLTGNGIEVIRTVKPIFRKYFPSINHRFMTKEEAENEVISIVRKEVKRF